MQRAGAGAGSEGVNIRFYLGRVIRKKPKKGTYRFQIFICLLYFYIYSKLMHTIKR